MELLSFDGIDLADVVSRIPRKGRDRMPFGIIELDYDGRIVAYNMGEAKMSKRNPKEMIGLNFFEDVAPCTKTPVFYGRFKAGVKAGNLNARFDYLFDHEMEPLAVRVTMITSTIDSEPRVLVLIRILKDEDRERAQIDHGRMSAIEKARAERAEKEQREQAEKASASAQRRDLHGSCRASRLLRRHRGRHCHPQPRCTDTACPLAILTPSREPKSGR